ncbi:hypothetical protein [Paenibacillus fonticola]|uniref:hypothetical protein n=1 Tax=Paenibacillus fonticola TaxID=379896 RepID=UPI000380BFA2|nr:hypothetical protein [Paenibacillus fonticola]
MYEKLVALNDQAVLESLDRQVLDEGSRYYGGVADPVNGIAWASHGGTPMVMALWAAALINEDSRYYQDRELLKRLELGAEFLLKFQHADGSISPGWTNMHSPPDTAFVVGGLAQVYELLESHTSGWQPLRTATGRIRLFLERTIPVLLTGGCHTPNHRWVLTAALGFLYKLTGQPELKARAEAWLAEGIDCTEDGEWTERSNGIYNGVSDIVMFYTAELLDRPELLEPVRRNLRMMAYLIHPDGEVVTDYSGRQDFGAKHDMAGYFLVSRLMESRDKDPLFAAITDAAGEALTHPGWLPNNAMIGYLRYPELRERQVQPVPLPEQYRVVLNRYFPREQYLMNMEAAGHFGRIYHSRLHLDFGAPVARQRSGDTSMTVMTETSSFLSLRHGAVRLLAVQLASSFEPGYVKMNRLEELPRGYRLSGDEFKGYYGPVPQDALPPSASGPVSPWYLLPHQLREVTHQQQHHVEAELTEEDNGLRLRVKCLEPEGMMTQVCFIFGSEGTLSGEGLVRLTETEEFQFWKSGRIRCSVGADWIELEGGQHEHWAKALNNTSYPSGCRSIVVNLMTPYDWTFDIRLSPSGNASAGDENGPSSTGEGVRGR